MNTYYNDVLNQPESLRKCIDGIGKKETINKYNNISQLKYDKVIFSGMGSSNYCSVSASIILANERITNFRISTSELLHYKSSLINETSLLVLTSQSGESAEIVSLIEQIPKKCPVIAITNDQNSTLAKRGNVTLLLNVEAEEAVTTRTYLASIVINNMVAYALSEKKISNFLQPLNKGVEILEDVLRKNEEITNIMLDKISNPPYLFLLGRGESLSTVEAGTLFMREIVKYPAMGLDCGEFKHGPLEMVDEKFNAIIFSPNDQTRSLNEKLACSIENKGGNVVFVTTGESSNLLNKGIAEINLPYIEKWLSPLISVVPVQLYANRLAVIRGVEAGKFRWGSKIMKEE